MSEGVDAGDWDHWWKARGEALLTVLLWAVWNPIGFCPPDEYENYSGRVVQLLKRHHDPEQEPGLVQLEGRATELAKRLAGDLPDSEREALYAEFLKEVNTYPAARDEGVERLAGLFGQLRRDTMGCNADPAADRNAAERLRDWYWWEMTGWG
jgi:hypothetical protein